MGIKRYILLSVVFILAIGLYVFSFNGESYYVELVGLSLPVALWIVTPLILLVIASVVHMEFYHFKNYFHQRGLKKDFENFKELAKQTILSEKTAQFHFKTPGFKNSAEILKAMKFDANSDVSITDEELAKCYEIFKRISQGHYEDLKKYKLSKENPLVIQNSINRLLIEPKYAYEVLKNCKDKNSELCIKAYDALLNIASFNEIKRYDFTPDKRTFRRMMERYLDADDSFEMDIKSIEDMLEQFNADRADYLELAREIKIKLTPDALIALFEKLYNAKGSVAADAYLYVLYDLQMIDKIRDILDNADEDEFVKFKTVIFLRDHGKSIDIDKFLRV